MQFEERDRVIDEFRKGLTKILIATDVLSRGFDQVRPPPSAHHPTSPSRFLPISRPSC